VLEVPFVDVLNTMSDASLPLTIQECLEWGNSNIKADYDVIKTYSPSSSPPPPGREEENLANDSHKTRTQDEQAEERVIGLANPGPFP
jgi:oligopeptidase B